MGECNWLYGPSSRCLNSLVFYCHALEKPLSTCPVTIWPDKRIMMDSQPLIFNNTSKLQYFHSDFSDEYLDAREELDPCLPEPYGEPLTTTVFFCNADHVHDIVTCCSINGICILWAPLLSIGSANSKVQLHLLHTKWSSWLCILL
jgi:hypothetical protein